MNSHTFTEQLDNLVASALAEPNVNIAHVIYQLDMAHARVQQIAFARERAEMIRETATAIMPATTMPKK